MSDENNNLNGHHHVIAEVLTLPAACDPAYPPKPVYRFTSANAREMAARSAQKRRQRKADAKALANGTPSLCAPETEWTTSQLALVRAMLKDNDERFRKATDPLDRDRLARVSLTLSERERVLSGRPLPGALRPTARRAAGRGSAVEPV